MENAYGYIRVSAKDQNINRQVDSMFAVGVLPNRLYVDKQRGKDFERPAYRRLVKRVRPGDLLIVKSIDRLGRNYDEIMEQWRILTKECVIDIRVLEATAGHNTRKGLAGNLYRRPGTPSAFLLRLCGTRQYPPAANGGYSLCKGTGRSD